MPIIEQYNFLPNTSGLSPERAEIISQAGLTLEQLVRGMKIFTGRLVLRPEEVSFLFQTLCLTLSLLREQKPSENFPQTFEQSSAQEGDFYLGIFRRRKGKNKHFLALAAIRIRRSNSCGISLYPLANVSPDGKTSEMPAGNHFVQYKTVPLDETVALTKFTFRFN